MKLKRYGQFVRGINEEREAPKYDKIEDFRKQMDMLDDEAGDAVAEPVDDESPVYRTEDPYMSKMGGRKWPTEGGYDDDVDPEWGATDADEFGDEGEESEEGELGDDAPVPPDYAPGEVDAPEGDTFGDEARPPARWAHAKLDELAQILGVELHDNRGEVGTEDTEDIGKQIKFGEHTVNYYSETGNLHIGSKEFETAEDAAKFLKGGQARMVRDTNESKSYRFRRRKNR
jgi:hypothetical protein